MVLLLLYGMCVLLCIWMKSFSFCHVVFWLLFMGLVLYLILKFFPCFCRFLFVVTLHFAFPQSFFACRFFYDFLLDQLLNYTQIDWIICYFSLILHIFYIRKDFFHQFLFTFCTIFGMFLHCSTSTSNQFRCRLMTDFLWPTFTDTSGAQNFIARGRPKY